MQKTTVSTCKLSQSLFKTAVLFVKTWTKGWSSICTNTQQQCLLLIQFRVKMGLEHVTAVRSPVCRRANTERQTTIYTLDSPVNLTCMSLDYLMRTHAGTGRTCSNLHIKAPAAAFKPRAVLRWDSSLFLKLYFLMMERKGIYCIYLWTFNC